MCQHHRDSIFEPISLYLAHKLVIKELHWRSEYYFKILMFVSSGLCLRNVKPTQSTMTREAWPQTNVGLSTHSLKLSNKFQVARRPSALVYAVSTSQFALRKSRLQLDGATKYVVSLQSNTQFYNF